MTRWRPRPDDESAIKARKLDGEVVLYEELRAGDVFQAIDHKGEVLDPITEEPDDTVYARVTQDPFRNEMVGVGYVVFVETGVLEDFQKRVLN